MRRREFITLLGGAAAAWPLAAGAQQPERKRTIGVLTPFAANDAEGQARLTAFAQGLQHSGWIVGQNIRRISLGRRQPAGDAAIFPRSPSWMAYRIASYANTSLVRQIAPLCVTDQPFDEFRQCGFD